MATKKVLRGKDLVSALHRKLVPHVEGPYRVRNALGKQLGYSTVRLWSWQTKNELVGPNQVANLVSKAQEAARSSPIQPVIEFFDFSAVNESIKKIKKGRKYKSYRVFDSDNKYELGIRKELEKSRGVYIFYDSRGRALYVGKATKQSLWKEIHNALNRSRDVQRIKRVEHPKRHVIFRPSDQKVRQIRPVALKLYELANYLSAYSVSPSAIAVFEAVLVRSFANDLLNVRMEQFTSRRKRRKF